MAGLLEQYRLKRDFKRTSEPAGKREPTARKAKFTGGLFVIHKHDARRLHYDLRLEHNGVLWSWAVTRGPSLDSADKRLAVHVEDHPLDYAGFEGTIPKGAYGAGSVIVWDQGKWTPEDDPAVGMKKGHLNFELEGQKLRGGWHLVRLKRREKEKRDNWLLIKADDAFAKADGDILEAAPKSVKSGLTIKEISKGKKSKAVPKTPVTTAKRKLGPMPGFIPPALATLKAQPPSGKDWLHEVKFDGYRIQAHVSAGKVKLLTRSGLDWTTRFGEVIPRELLALNCNQAVIDGEFVVLSAKGVASFSLLQADLSENRGDRIVFYAFDLLHLNNRSLIGEPLSQRKSKLEELLIGQPRDSAVRYSEHFAQSGEIMLAHACRMGLEGVISKRIDAVYQSGRTRDWIKSKCTLRQEFVIIGYLTSAATGRGLRSLLVAYHDKGKLRYAGRVGTGFSARSGDEVKSKLDKLRVKAPMLEGIGQKEKNAVWVRPELLAEVEFRAWTDGGILRQASFQGLREDKPADHIVKEVSTDKLPGSKSLKQRKPVVSVPSRKTSVQLSNADKLLWPKAKISKRDLLDYYGSVWPRMEQFIINRPLSLLRAPDGVGGQLFFQKHASAGMHEAISILRDPEDGQEHLYIWDFNGLAALVQLGVVEIHIWGAKIDAIETPDQIVFDLDPDEGLAQESVRAAALDVKKHLQDLGFAALVKTSGGKGFHVVTPLKPKVTWEKVKTFAHDFAQAMTQSAPERYTATLAKKVRKGRVFIDYLRNGRGSTTVAPYSLRANPEATISMPIDWQLLKEGISPKAFVINGNATRNILSQPDPWRDFFKIGKTLRK
jgi:bifunctional non-homologous end joining protein LigD